jgi:predicted metal-dependent hydrolase
VGVVRKPIKNLHLSVHPPDGSVRVSAPSHMDDEAVRLAVVSKPVWIRRDDFLPQWRSCRDELNQTPLAHEEWAS